MRVSTVMKIAYWGEPESRLLESTKVLKVTGVPGFV
jgi:hypothetical protein